jgi:hypothetical protein
MAFSLQDDLYVALYSIWEDEAEDAAHQAWVTDHMRYLEPFASGIQLADANFKRLQALRAKHDPTGMFHSYMGLPR